MELLISCNDNLDQAATPVCPTDYGRIVTILLSKTPVTKTGNQPSAAEFGTAYNAGTLIFIDKIINGKKIQINEDEIEVVYKEWHDKKYRLEGRIRLVSEVIARICEHIDRCQILYAYCFTDKNYCFGGYYASPDFSQVIFDGKGNPIYIHFKLDFFPGIDYAVYDEDYDTFTSTYLILATPDDYGLMTPDGSILIL